MPGHSYTVLAARENGPTLVVAHIGAGCVGTEAGGADCVGTDAGGAGCAGAVGVGAGRVGTACVEDGRTSVIGVGCAA